MRKIYFLVIIYLLFFSPASLLASICDINKPVCHDVTFPDSLRERQSLFIGTQWENKFKRISGDQYLFSNVFLPGTITFNGKKFTNLQIRYDIFSDEIMIPRNLDQIIKLNKEMVDSFSISYNNRNYRFIKLETDTTGSPDGYVNIIFRDRSALYVKYRKDIFTEITYESDGEFYQVSRVYFMKNGISYAIRRLNDFYGIVQEEKVQIKEFIRENKLKVSVKDPESLVPVIRFYDSLKR